MATVNPFDLLGDDDNDDPSHLIAAAQQAKAAAAAAAAAAAKKPASPASASAPEKPSAKLPSKPLPPAQAVKEARETRNNVGPTRGDGAGRGVPGRGRGGRGPPNRDYRDERSNGFAVTGEADATGSRPIEGERGGGNGYGVPRQPYRGGRRGEYGNSDDFERPRRPFERRSGTGRGYEVKREGAGRGNWGTTTDEVLAQTESEKVVNENDKVASPEKKAEPEDGAALDGNKDNADGAANESEKEPEDKEMTLEEYEKIREEKRKALLARKNEERKVEPDQELQSMQQLSLKKGNDEYFVKLGSDKKGRKKESSDQDEKAKKLSINEFLKPAEGGRYYGGRGRGRGRGDRPSHGGYGGGGPVNSMAPSIEDPGQFPTLGK